VNVALGRVYDIPGRHVTMPTAGRDATGFADSDMGTGKIS
jgi:hypothetical protein